MMHDPFVKARGVRKSFGSVEVLHDVDLDLRPGEVTALLGENGAGKSTFVKILAGEYRADAGEILIGGIPNAELGITGTRDQGLRVISQELTDAPTLSVEENISLGSWPMRGPFVDRRAMRRIARRVLAQLGSDLAPGRKASTLRLGERQQLEIARAMVGDMHAVIFDEPTAALSDAEARNLFEVIGQLTAQGMAVLYITHRLDEVFAIAHRTVVLRDGVVALDAPVTEVTTPDLIEAMVGHRVAIERYGRSTEAGDAAHAPIGSGGALEVDAISGGSFADVSFTVPRGGIVGLYGKVGSGVVELAKTLFGARRLEAGSIRKDGRPLRLGSPAEAIRAGIGYLPADRKGDAILPVRSVAENLAAPSWDRLGHAGFVSRRAEADAYSRWHGPLGVRSKGDPGQIITTLSGGNQQKVLLARWLERDSDILVLTEPTRGVDVGARQEIYQMLRRLAERGVTVLIATSDYEDIVAVADEVHVFIRGRQVAFIPEPAITVDSLTRAAGGASHD